MIAHYVASALAAPIMVEQGSGLIVNISFPGGENLIYPPSLSLLRVIPFAASDLKRLP